MKKWKCQCKEKNVSEQGARQNVKKLKEETANVIRHSQETLCTCILIKQFYQKAAVIIMCKGKD